VTPSSSQWTKPRRKFSEVGFDGPFPLDRFVVETLVEGSGVYALVERTRTRDFVVIYVGRGQLRRRLSSHASERRASYFYVKRLHSTLTAYDRECQMFVRYGRAWRLDNRIYPAIPWGGVTRCSERSA
jgi:hypothetical protein